MDDSESLNRRCELSVDISRSDDRAKYANSGYGHLNALDDGVFGHRDLDPSLDNSITICTDFIKHENTGGRCYDFPENGTHDDTGFGFSGENSILTQNDPLRSYKISDHDLNPEFLEDLDIYLDDLITRLTVRKMVNDSIIKGMVTAIVDEANEKIAAKDMQILGMSEKLHRYKLAETVRELSSSIETEHKQEGQRAESCSLDPCLEHIHTDCLYGLQIATFDQLHILKKSIEHLICTSLMEVNSLYISRDPSCCSVVSCDKGQLPDNLNKFDNAADALKMFVGAVTDQVNKIFCLFEDSISEHKLTYNLDNEFIATAINDSITKLHDEFGRRLCHKRKMHCSNFSTIFDEIKHLRKELDHVLRSLFSSELGHAGCQSGHENVEDRNAVRPKDNSFSTPSNSSMVMLETTESPQLLCMTKEDLIGYYRAEINKMRRHHESALQEKTEELFSVKRELLKEKGSFPSKKDRDYEILRRSIPEMIAKLDNILLDSEKYMIEEDDEKYATKKGNSCDLLWDCQSSRDLLLDKNEINEWLLRRETDKMPYLSGELLQADGPEWDIEDVQIDSELREIVHKEFWRCWISETKNHFESIDMEVKTIHEIYATMLTVSLEESKAMIDNMKTKYDDITNLLENSLHRKENTLHSEVERVSILMHELQSLSKQIEVKEEHIKEIEGASILQKKLFEETYQELSLLRVQENKQAELLLNSRNELESVKNQLEKATSEVHQYEEIIANFDTKLLVALNRLDESNKEKETLQDIIQVRENQILIMNMEERVQRKKIRSLIFSVLEISKSYDPLVGNLLEKIQTHTARLDSLQYQMGQLMQQVDLLKGKISSYEYNLKIKSSNLCKAETEVDLLGDEVDALLNLLARIYIALEHYAPVFQHYPGVMDILNLIKTEVKGV